jgi:hypothetical protein
MLNRYFFRRAITGSVTACLEGTVVGHETILNHPTTAIELRYPPKLTVWTAPDLGCFALRITSEVQRPDGSFRLENLKQALRVKTAR